MQLIGMLDSPYVRRVAISLALLGIEFEHRPVSVFRHFEEFASLNPVVKAPTLIDDHGPLLIDSSLILDHLDHKVAAEKRLMPQEPGARQRALSLIGFALAAAEKTVQIVYEKELRPADKLHQPWLDRVNVQLTAAYDMLEREVAAAAAKNWLMGERIMQPDVTVAVVWRFTQHILPGNVDPTHYPALARFSERAEALPAFVATPLE